MGSIKGKRFDFDSFSKEFFNFSCSCASEFHCYSGEVFLPSSNFDLRYYQHFWKRKKHGSALVLEVLCALKFKKNVKFVIHYVGEQSFETTKYLKIQLSVDFYRFAYWKSHALAYPNKWLRD